MGDSNDIVYNEYGLDFFGLLKALFGGSGNTGSTGGGGSVVDVGYTLADSLHRFIDFLSSTWSVLVVLSWLVSAALVYLIIYAYLRASHYDALQDEFIELNERVYKELYGGGVENKRWDDVLAHIASDEPNNWRLAIIEADIMLEDVLEKAGYAGTTIGDKLKSASTNTFATLQHAWDAHLIRNKIAHQGSDFVLTKKLAQETITQYRMVFEEFGVV